MQLVPRDDPRYIWVKFGRWGLLESSKVDAFPRPEKLIEIYEFEACPYCRKVREAISILDIDVIFYPCPKNGPTWRKKVKEETGKTMFPYMKDPNTGVAMFESDDIIRYLFQRYGDGHVPWTLSFGPLTVIHCALGNAPRAMRGRTYSPSRLPKKPLVVWGSEGSPYSKLVREVLVELEIPYIQVTTGRGSPKRQILFDARGRFQMPYLEDENEGVAMFESKYIIEYLRSTYGVEAPNKTD